MIVHEKMEVWKVKKHNHKLKLRPKSVNFLSKAFFVLPPSPDRHPVHRSIITPVLLAAGPARRY